MRRNNEQQARFQIGDVCLYEDKRYTVISPVWVHPFPGYMSWHIERLLDPNDALCQLADRFRHTPFRPRTLEEVITHGLVTERDGNFYQERTVSEDDMARLDDPPTWAQVDALQARVNALSAELKALYRKKTARRKTER